uniref:Uncharacterized protein n=1 Tax=Arundo donax TaxID=35708 RepID=A0A0A9A0J5_ARUDO
MTKLYGFFMLSATANMNCECTLPN